MNRGIVDIAVMVSNARMHQIYLMHQYTSTSSPSSSFVVVVASLVLVYFHTNRVHAHDPISITSKNKRPMYL